MRTAKNMPAPIQTPASRLVTAIPTTPATKPTMSETTNQAAEVKTSESLDQQIETEADEGRCQQHWRDHVGVEVGSWTKRGSAVTA